MKTKLYLFFPLLLLTGLTSTASAQVSNENEDGVYKVDEHHSQDYVPGEVLFKLNDGHQARVRRVAGRFQSAGINSLDKVLSEFDVQDIEQLLPNATVGKTPRRAKTYNGDIIEERDLTQLYRVTLSEDNEEKTLEMIEQLNKLDEIEFAEPNYKVYIMANDNIADDYSANPMVSQQWYLDAYGVKELWNKPIINKTRPIIAIIDTGVDITHPDLKDNIWTNQSEENGRADYDNDRNGFKNDVHGWDFINNTPKMRDNNSHGTHVAGIAAATNNGVGIVGANPRALIMPITVLQSDGIGDNATLIKGINYAVKNGANVINMSIGTYGNSNAMRQALAQAYQSAIIVAAAGNEEKCIYKSHPHYPPPMPCFPAAYSFVIGVQATTPAGNLASFSNYDDDGPLSSCESTAQDPDGFNYELKAPGVGILSTIPGGGYQQLSGTSMASPLVAGAVSALMMVKQYDNQEILWGDLLHTNNIAEAFNVSSRPAELDIMRIELHDRNEQVDDDLKYYDVNVGETINIYPKIRTSFGSASNIKLNLIAPLNVEVITSEADFGYNLDAFGKMTSKNPLVIKVPDEMPNASEIEILVQATCKESNETFSKTFVFRVANMYTLKGLLTEDMTLTPDHVYYVRDRFGVNVGTTLTIKPGTRLEFAKDAGLYAFGTLNAKGTPEAPIIFTAFNKSEPWRGVYSHESDGRHYFYNKIYTNVDSTLFTFLPTNNTPIELANLSQAFYYDTEDNKPKNLNLEDYLINWSSDMTGRNELLTDPSYLTPVMLHLLNEWKNYYKLYPTYWTDEKRNRIYVSLTFPSWQYYTNPTDTIAYCRIDGNNNSGGSYYTTPFYNDCVLNSPTYVRGKRNVVSFGVSNILAEHTNIINIVSVPLQLFRNGPTNNNLFESNFFNNSSRCLLSVISSQPDTVMIEHLPYCGTGREEVLRPLIYEYGNTNGNSDTYAILDLSNMQKEPSSKAHGIVWKVLVDGIDPQDECEDMLPLGVGKHKFDVYFNRQMNKNVIPQISFGVISPYTQHPVTEDGNWNEEGTIYTAYITIDGKTQSDGMNRIYVHGAEDDEFFPCPYEATRFNIMIQAVGSMASGFQAEAGLGNVKLTWNNEKNDFEDAMGFNVYRYTERESGVNDTIRLNDDILDISATSYVDDQVFPGQTYYYYYKVLSTALKEYDISNVVAATPLTATRGDANGSGVVDVADVVTSVNYVTGLQPKPFVFDAADMNSDKLIDIFDVVGIIRGILNPGLLSTASVNEETATYTIENGTLYVESPVSLAGVQVQLALDGRCKMEDVRVAEDLDGFECTSAWLSDNDYLFLAYSMNGKTLSPGKHALLHIGDALIASMRLSDANGHNVEVTGDDATKVNRMASDVMSVPGIYDLKGRKLTGDCNQEGKLPKGIYIINGRKIVR